MAILATAFLSAWSIGAGVSLAAAAAALALKGPARVLGVATGFGLFAVLGTVALLVASPAQPPTPQLPAPPAPGNIAGAETPGLALLAEAERRLNTGDDRGALESFNRALELFRGSGDLAGQGHAHLGLGRVEHFTGQGDAARAHYARARELFQQDGSPAGEARVLVAMGDLELDTFQWSAAAQYFREGRRVWAAVPAPKSDSHVMLKLETVVSMPEGAEAAWAVLDQAALIFDNLGDVDGLGDVAMLRADLHAALGDFHAALAGYTVAAFQYREAGSRAREAFAALRTAEFETLEGHNAEAAARLERAGSIFADVADPVGLAMVEAARGDLARLLGDMTAARVHYAAAAEAFRAHGHPGEAHALLKLGQVEAYIGNAATARPALEAAARLHATHATPRGEAAALLSLGQLAAGAGEPGEAQEHWTRATELARGAGDALLEGRALLAFAGLAASTGDSAAAGVFCDNAEARFAAAQVPMGAILVALGRGDLARESSAVAAADAYRAAAAALAALAEPVAEANRILGLPPVSRIFLVDELDQELGGDEPDLRAAARLKAAREANLAAHPDNNQEGRTFVAVVEARIAQGLAAAN